VKGAQKYIMNYKTIFAIVLIIVLVIILWGYLRTGSEFDIDEARFEELSKQPDAVIIDVRSEKEFNEGKIDGAILMNINRPDFKVQIEKLDKNKTYLIYCRSGNRSRKACTVMSEMGFTKCYNLKKGINSWVKSNKPVQN
jgi:rhodanese-related sulfurtransferase